MRPDIEPDVLSALPPLRVSWSLMIVISFAWAGLGLFASPVVSLSGSPAGTLWTTLISVLGVLCAVATLLIDRVVITPKRMAALIPVPDHALVQRHLLAGHLVLSSFAVLPAFFGFAQLLLDGSLRIHLALCALSLAVLTLLMPTRTRIAARLAAVLARPAAPPSLKTKRTGRKKPA